MSERRGRSKGKWVLVLDRHGFFAALLASTASEAQGWVYSSFVAAATATYASKAQG